MKKNFSTLRSHAIAGDAKAQNELGRRLWYGRGVKTNRSSALEWLRRAARSGIVEHEAFLGWLLCWEGRDVQEAAEGIRWLRKAAKGGHVQAQYDLAVSYALGEFVRRNPKQARHWYGVAAKGGHTEAQYNLGVMHWEGDGGPKSTRTAHKWWLSAAEHGDLLANTLLADAYASGTMGLPADPKKAAYWRRRAVRSRNN